MNPFSLSDWENYWTFFQWFSMIASSKQRQKHNTLATIWIAKTQGSPWVLQEPLVCKHLEPKMQTLIRMDGIVSKDHYHMTIVDENVIWMKLTHLLSRFFSKTQGRLLYIYLYFRVLDNLFQLYTLEKNNTSPLRILCKPCMLIPQIIPLLTLMLIHMWCEESTP